MAEDHWGARNELAEDGEDEEAATQISIKKRMALMAQGMGTSLSRTFAAVGEVILDSELRTKSVARMAEAAVGVGKGAFCDVCKQGGCN
jgi:hypothetical protein